MANGFLGQVHGNLKFSKYAALGDYPYYNFWYAKLSLKEIAKEYNNVFMLPTNDKQAHLLWTDGGTARLLSNRR